LVLGFLGFRVFRPVLGLQVVLVRLALRLCLALLGCLECCPLVVLALRVARLCLGFQRPLVVPEVRSDPVVRRFLACLVVRVGRGYLVVPVVRWVQVVQVGKVCRVEG
jgi:hypothetical protein